MRLLCSAILLLTVILGGCAEKKTAVIPDTPPGLPKQRPVRKDPSSVKKEPPPVKKEPPPVKKESPPSTVLSLEASQEEEDRLKQEAMSRIDGAERIVTQIDQNRLAEDQRGTFLTLQSFLSKAREALSLEDFLRAFNLADKAQILAQELLNSLR
jgi:hypothetical protein